MDFSKPIDRSKDETLGYYISNTGIGSRGTYVPDIEECWTLSIPEPRYEYLVVIIQGGTKKCDSNIRKLLKLFSSEIFLMACSSQIFIDNEYSEVETMKKIFFSLKKMRGNLPLIVVKDNTVSEFSPEILDLKIKNLTNIKINDKSPELYYLCSWGHDPKNYKTINENTIQIFEPKATQCILYTVEGRDYILDFLNNNKINSYSGYLQRTVSDKKLTAIAHIPNLLYFDMGLSTSKDDFKKMNYFSENPNSDKPIAYGLASFIWFIIIVILIIAIACALVQLGPSYKIERKATVDSTTKT